MKFGLVNRRDFIVRNAVSLGVLSSGLGATDVFAALTAPNPTPIFPGDPSLVSADFQALISRSDLYYSSPVENSSQGQPIGNGRMGTMVWTTPSSVQFQINRNDVFAVNRNHRGGFMGDLDICGACAGVAIDVGGQPFAKQKKRGSFQQHLSMYAAESTIQSGGVHVRCFVSAMSDVLVVEIDDKRPASAKPPAPLKLTLSLWGEKIKKADEHVASFAFVKDGDRYSATRKFTEREHYSASAATVQAVTGHMTLASATDTQQTFEIERGTAGKTRILIASAASMDPTVDLVARTASVLDGAAKQSAAALLQAHRAWWAGLWSRTFIHMTSPDGVADFMERLHTLHLYIMASTSRGTPIAPKWNDMLFGTSGDARPFGAQYWGWTMEPLYLPLPTAGAFDLMDPYFDMYVAQLPTNRLAAQQRWGAKGAFFPETAPFDGAVVFPDDIGREYRELYRGTSKGLSERASERGGYDSTIGYFTQISHIWTTGAKISMQAWCRYRCSGDAAWLRSHAYPLLHDTAEFYRSVVIKKPDGKYHIEGSNVHESFSGVNDGIMDLGAIRGVVPLAIRAAEILNVDPELRAQWRDLLDNLSPYPMGTDPEAKALANSVLADDVWAVAHKGEGPGNIRGDEDLWLTPVFPFENYTLETKDPETKRIVDKLVELAPVGKGLFDGTAPGIGTSMRSPILFPRTGLGEYLPVALCSYQNIFGLLPNGMSTFELGALSIEQAGVLSMTMQEGLMQSLSATPGAPEVIRVFPAWPKTWNATFSLVARGGFLVTSTIKNGVIAFVEIKSNVGETCQIHNPWNKPCFLAEAGKPKQRQTDELIRFETKAGTTYRLFPEKLPAPIHVVPKPGVTPTTFALKMPNGKMLKGKFSA